MDYGMIGKLEKAKRYAEDRKRFRFNKFDDRRCNGLTEICKAVYCKIKRFIKHEPFLGPIISKGERSWLQ